MSIRIIYLDIYMYRLHFQFNDISHSLTCESLVIRLNGRRRIGHYFSDAVNQRNVTARNFYRFAHSSRDSTQRESASYRIKQSEITREPRRIIEADAGDSVVQFASQREREKGRRGGTTSIFSKARKRETKRKRTTSRA